MRSCHVMIRYVLGSYDSDYTGMMENEMELVFWVQWFEGSGFRA